MNTAEKTYSDQPHHRDEGALVADAPTTKGNHPDQSPPDVRLQLSELRIALEKIWIEGADFALDLHEA